MVRLRFKGRELTTGPWKRGSKAYPIDKTSICVHFRHKRLHGLGILQRLGANIRFLRSSEMPSYGDLQMENEGRCSCLRNTELMKRLLLQLACVDYDCLEPKDRSRVRCQMLATGYAFLRGSDSYKNECEQLRLLLLELAEDQCQGVVVSVGQVDGAEVAKVITTWPSVKI